MSSLLEQAIVDASALREAALKNAEQAIIEKYAPDIKEAVEKILEQDELLDLEDDEEGDFPPEFDAAGEEVVLDSEEEIETYVQPPLAAADGENLCPCPEEEQPVEMVIDLSQMAKDIAEAEKKLGIPFINEDFPKDAEKDEAEEEMAQKSDAQSQEDPIEEEFELSEDMFDALLEKVTVDGADATLSGWMARPQSEIEELEKLRLLALQDTERKEEFNKLNDTLKGLQESTARTGAKNKSLKGNVKKLTETINVLKEKFDEMTVINSRLLYTNRILKDTSLNERQKSKVVEALSKCSTINEAKVIYETLQSSVSSQKSKPAMPQSLREAISRNSRSSTIIPTRRGSQTRELSFADRMKTLAGITDKNKK